MQPQALVRDVRPPAVPAQRTAAESRGAALSQLVAGLAILAKLRFCPRVRSESSRRLQAP